MFTTVLLLALAALAMGGRHDHRERSSSSSSSSGSGGLSRDAAVQAADELIRQAKLVNPVGGESSGFRTLNEETTETESSSSSSSSSTRETQLSTSDRLHIAVEERLIEAAIRQAVAAPAAKPAVLKKAYQARYEITAFENGERLKTAALSFGPTVISTRRNFFLSNTGQQTAQFWTMGDFLDADSNGEPDILPALKTFRDTAEPAEYLRVLRNRASSAQPRLDTPLFTTETASIDLINLIRLDGRFSVTNQLMSPCFSATNEREFVFETLVGLPVGEFADGARLSANPDQTSSVLLAGSTAVSNADPLIAVSTFGDQETLPAVGGVLGAPETSNVFFDHALGQFVDSVSINLWTNVVPDALIPGVDDSAVQGTVHLSACASFSYFN